MGYVPSRQYPGMTGELQKGRLTIVIPSGEETTWLLTHHWLKNNRRVRATTSADGMDCTLVISGFMYNISYEFRNINVDITAEGTVSVSIVSRPRDADKLREAMRFVEYGDPNISYSFD